MIAMEDVSIRSGSFQLQRLSLHIAAQEYAVLMGRTGCGKTTVLEAICGLRTVLSGSIVVGGVNVTHLPPAARSIGYVPQDLALFPPLTVRQHLEFAPRLQRWTSAQIADRVEELASVLGLTPLMNRRIQRLSGGEAQRVALGRALSFRPTVLLLDEPLSALDENTRGEMHTLLRTIRKQSSVTTLHVTHDRREADALADRLFRVHDGQLIESATDASRARRVSTDADPSAV